MLIWNKKSLSFKVSRGIDNIISKKKLCLLLTTNDYILEYINHL